MSPALNIETKARFDDFALAAEKLEGAGAHHAGILLQRDQYFDVTEDRLKLRTVEEHPVGGTPTAHMELIAYQRPNVQGARTSRYTITKVDDVEATLGGLRADHGLRVEVVKLRQLWLLGSTRIHLDAVDELGNFVELETVDDGRPHEVLWQEHRRLAALLDISDSDCIAESYVDLLESAQQTR